MSVKAIRLKQEEHGEVEERRRDVEKQSIRDDVPPQVCNTDVGGLVPSLSPASKAVQRSFFSEREGNGNAFHARRTLPHKRQGTLAEDSNSPLQRVLFSPVPLTPR